MTSLNLCIGVWSVMPHDKAAMLQERHKILNK